MFESNCRDAVIIRSHRHTVLAVERILPRSFKQVESLKTVFKYQLSNEENIVLNERSVD